MQNAKSTLEKERARAHTHSDFNLPSNSSSIEHTLLGCYASESEARRDERTNTCRRVSVATLLLLLLYSVFSNNNTSNIIIIIIQQHFNDAHKRAMFKLERAKVVSMVRPRLYFDIVLAFCSCCFFVWRVSLLGIE